MYYDYYETFVTFNDGKIKEHVLYFLSGQRYHLRQSPLRVNLGRVMATFDSIDLPLLQCSQEADAMSILIHVCECFALDFVTHMTTTQ